MVSKLGYDSYVKRLNSAMVAAILVGGLISAALVTSASAQINGTPASVTSINSGGHLNSTPGVPASITSLDRTAFNPETRFPINLRAVSIHCFR